MGFESLILCRTENGQIPKTTCKGKRDEHAMPKPKTEGKPYAIKGIIRKYHDLCSSLPLLFAQFPHKHRRNYKTNIYNKWRAVYQAQRNFT